MDDQKGNSNDEDGSSSWGISDYEIETAAGEPDSACSSNSRVVSHFREMGFSEDLVYRALKETDDGDTDKVLEVLLSYNDLQNAPREDEQQNKLNVSWSSESESEISERFFNMDIWSESENEGIVNDLTKNDETICQLVEMGYNFDTAVAATKSCGPKTPIEDLIQFIFATQVAENTDTQITDTTNLNFFTQNKKRKKILSNQTDCNDETEGIRLPKPMVGFGVPNLEMSKRIRRIPQEAEGPPFFYFENVANAPAGVWETIRSCLYDIEPEFVDSKFFCAAARKRGYIHNLPIENRFSLPIPPRTIQEILPETRRWWPEWDPRTQFSCILTCVGCARITNGLKTQLEMYTQEPPENVKKQVLSLCRKFNFIWVGLNKLAMIEPNEIEIIMGFPHNHTRGGGMTRTERYKVLGNTFQVDTVAWHLSVLKEMFPNGINVLSLFSGIGGAEVALNRLGIKLNNVVSVEISEYCHNILRSWWDETKPKGNLGNLIQVHNVETIDARMIENWMNSFGDFDLVIGGSPCNNLSGTNRKTRVGLAGEHSSLFFEYERILKLGKNVMRNRHW